jgi:hypothetical protein
MAVGDENVKGFLRISWHGIFLNTTGTGVSQRDYTGAAMKTTTDCLNEITSPQSKEKRSNLRAGVHL